MSKVLVTLDFDGVVSPIDHDRDFRSEAEFSIFRLGGFSCAISDQVLSLIGYLKELSESHPEELALRWATSWESLTEHFEKSTDGVIPSFGYLPLLETKARAIADEALAQDASLVVVFEDHGHVQEELEELWAADSRFEGRSLSFLKTETKHGIQFSDIVAAKSRIAFELGKGQ